MTDDTALLQATSSGRAHGRTTSIVLRWESIGEAVGFRLSRRAEGDAKSGRIGGRTAIRMPASAKELRAIVAESTPEWQTLARTLTAAQPGSLPTGSAPVLVDPAAVFDRGLTDTERRFILAGAQASLTMGRVAGLAFVDEDVVAGRNYRYDLRAVRADGSEWLLATEVPVHAGVFALPDPPSGLAAQVGDRRVLVLWNRNPYAATYVVQRAPAPGGPYLQVNPQPVAYDLDAGIDGSALPLPQPGFLDSGAWNDDGSPTTRIVAGSSVDGPDTGITYWYRVASRDTLDREGDWSAPVAATPVRSLAPMAPGELQVTPTTAGNGLAVQWRTVSRNVENHWLVDRGLPDATQTNEIFRADSREQLEDVANLAALRVATIVSDPFDLTTPTQSFTDTDPILIPAYGSTPFFYRVRVIDAHGIVGAPSAVVSGTVPDTIPPGPSTLTEADGAADHIRLEWKPNPEPDVAGYQVYRGVCDNGYVYVPGISHAPPKRGEKPPASQSRYHCDLTLVGDIGVGDATAMVQLNGIIAFDDYSVPSNSPICYAYWVRAYDFAGNLYPGDVHGCPLPGEYLCAALHEKTPPEAPVLTALRARNDGVQLEWIGAPVQDLHAFHVYRADSATAAPTFLACVFTDGTVSDHRWSGLVPSCSAVPAVADPLAARGTFLDPDAEPHQIYWYRIAALDWLGNESEGADLTAIPADSTFTFTSDLPVTPTVLPPLPSPADDCGLEVAWYPLYDPSDVHGFVVFRAAASQPYRQVSGILSANTFSDATARRGVDYSYQVQSIGLDGILSEPSAPVLHHY
jgi:hypothetical protein